MKLLSTAFVVVAVFLGADSDTSKPKPVTVSMVAVKAAQENRKETYFEPGLEGIRDAVSDLKYDTYRKVTSSRTTAPFGEEAKLPINATYTLYVTPVSKEPNGQIRLKTRIEIIPEDKTKKPVNTHVATVLQKPGKKLVLGGGMKLDEGELVVIITVVE